MLISWRVALPVPPGEPWVCDRDALYDGKAGRQELPHKEIPGELCRLGNGLDVTLGLPVGLPGNESEK